jgi:hypothetical protein
MMALGPSGELWCVPNSANYSITRIVAGSRDTIRTSRQVSPISLTSTERDTIIAQLGAGKPGGLEMSRVPKVKPAIEGITADGEGRLWVMRPALNGTRELDVIDAAGRVIATMSMGTIKTSRYAPFTVRGENIYLVVYDDDDVPFVVRFRFGK